MKKNMKKHLVIFKNKINYSVNPNYLINFYHINF